jgi:hypothetical protein
MNVLDNFVSHLSVQHLWRTALHVRYSIAPICASCSLLEFTVVFTGRWIGGRGVTGRWFGRWVFTGRWIGRRGQTEFQPLWLLVCWMGPNMKSTGQSQDHLMNWNAAVRREETERWLRIRPERYWHCRPSDMKNVLFECISTRQHWQALSLLLPRVCCPSCRLFPDTRCPLQKVVQRRANRFFIRTMYST